MKYVIVILFSLFSLAAYAQEAADDDIRDNDIRHLKGAVRSVTEKEYLVYPEREEPDTADGPETTLRFNDKGLVIEKRTCYSDTNECAHFVYVYDTFYQAGKESRMRLVKVLHVDDSGRLHDHIVFSYNNDGTSTSEQASGLSLSSRNVSCCGEVSETVTKLSEWTEKSKYDTNGLRIENKWVDSVDSCLQNVVYRYDSGGRLLKFTQTGLFHPWLFPSLPPLPKHTFTHKLKYNKQGFLAEDPHGKWTPQKYKYVYDATGNWVVRLSIEKGKATEICKRAIVYRN
jgi:hypothetical protein